MRSKGYRFLALSAVVATVLCIPTLAQLPNLSGPLDGGPVSGKRETVCPHRSASALAKFVERNSSIASKTASSIYAGDSGHRWAYLNVDEGSVPTLKEDGSTLDFVHPNHAGFVLYEKQNGAIEKSFWAHRFDRGEVITSGNNLSSEGVDNFAAIRDEIRAKRFSVIHVADESKERIYKDLIWTNSIVMSDSETPKSSDLASFRKINEQLAATLPIESIRHLSDPDSLFITTARTSGGDEIATIFSARNAKKYGHLIGEMHTLTNNPAHSREMVNGWFQNVRKGGKVYVYGVDLKSVDFSEIGASHDVELIRRGPTVVKDFLETDTQIETISRRKLTPETTSVLNGIPSTKEELEAMNKPSSMPEVWNDFRKKIEDQLEGRFSGRIDTRDELVKELTSGTSDVVFLLAHFDGKAVYFGKERISIDELEAAPSTRSIDDRPRVAVLLICNAGTLSAGERSLFRRQVKSVGEVFIKKGFFEKVVAPNRQIESPETISILSEYLSNGRVNRKGWMTLAEAKFPRKNHE